MECESESPLNAALASDCRRTHCGTRGSREPHPHLLREGGLQAPQDLGGHGRFAPSRDARSWTGSSRPRTWELPSRTSSLRWKRSGQGDRRCAQNDACYLPNTQALSCHSVGLRPVEARDYNTIALARTDEPKYNQVNIEFIYTSIALNLRDHAGGLEPAGLKMIQHITPKMYLEDLERIYTPADHLSAKRGKFEGRRQQLTESPMAYLSIMLCLYNRAQYNDQSYLIKRFLAGLLNETLKLQLILHHKQATDYEYT